MLRSWLLIFCSFFFLSLRGQTPDENKRLVDSLLKIVSKEKNSEKIAKVYLELSETYSVTNLDSVNYYAIQAEKSALNLIGKTKEEAHQKEAKTILAGAYNNRGFAYFNMGDFPNALKYHKKALDVWKQIKDTDGIGKSLNNLGAIYRQLGEFEDAQRFFNDALSIYKKKGDEHTVALIYNNLGGIYKMLDQNSKSIDAYRNALRLRKKIGDKKGLATTLNNIGAFYNKLGRVDSASYYFNQAYVLIQEVGDQIGIAHASSNMGEIALHQKEFDKAVQFGERSLAIGRSLGANMIIEQASGLLERVYQSKGNWKQAYEMQQLHYETKMKVKSEEAKNAAHQLEMQYNYEKQKEIDQIESEKQKALAENKSHIQTVTIYFVSILFVLVVLFSLLVFRRYKIILNQNKIIEKQNNERKIMLQEIHHRVKNNFQIISSLLRLQTYKQHNEDVNRAFNEAINRIHTMSTVHEIIYQQDAIDKIEPKKYLSILIDHLSRSLENGSIQIEVEACEDPLELDQTIPLGIIVNELITNSYKHAFSESTQYPRIRIALEKKNSLFQLTYSDNGVGYIPAKHGNSFGLELIDTMVSQISGKLEFYSNETWSTNFRISFS